MALTVTYKGLDKNLHAATEAKAQVNGRLFLDAIVWGDAIIPESFLAKIRIPAWGVYSLSWILNWVLTVVSGGSTSRVFSVRVLMNICILPCRQRTNECQMGSNRQK